MGCTCDWKRIKDSGALGPARHGFTGGTFKLEASKSDLTDRKPRREQCCKSVS